jgi:ketohexokinase
MPKKKVLIIGSVYEDLILTVSHYPQEDEKLRAIHKRVQYGGNGSNSAHVLCQYEHVQVEFYTRLPTDKGVRQWPWDSRVGVKYCRKVNGSWPLAVIWESDSSHSRTIVNHRDCESFSFHEFVEDVSVSECWDWVHLEGSLPYEVKQTVA